MEAEGRKASDSKSEPMPHVGTIDAEILDSVSDGFMMTDPDGRLSYFNAASRRMLAEHNVPADALCGRHFFDVFPEALDHGVGRAFLRTLNERVPTEIESFYPPFNRWYSNRFFPHAQGGVIMFSRDITERKRTEQALRMSEERFRTMADSSPLLIWMTDSRGRVEFLNRAYLEFFGVDENRLAQFDWRSVLHPDDADSYVGAIASAMERGLPFHRRVRARRADGEWRWLDSCANPRFDTTGEICGYTGCSPDITEICESQELLQRADQRKNEFLATLAHELRNPLAPILNSLNVLRVAGHLNPTAKSVHEMMERQVQHMVRLVDDLLEISRITRGAIDLRKEFVSLRTVIDCAVETSKPLIASAGHRLLVELPAEPVILDADPVRLTQVFANLLNNAAKYMEREGTIWVTARVESPEVAVSVRDSGIGIPRDMLAKVFDIFTQVDRLTEHTGGGLGIGLTLVKSLVQMHGGSVEAFSQGAGRGSEIVVRLPLAGENLRNVNESTPDDEHIFVAGAPRVLVVDDNEDAANSLAALLESMGADVNVAYDGMSALDMMQRKKPRIALLDVGMPDVSGYDVARRIRAQRQFDDVVLIALTGWSQKQDRDRSRDAGFNEHLVKPASLETLRALLQV